MATVFHAGPRRLGPGIALAVLESQISPFAVPARTPGIALIDLGWMVNSPPWLDRLRGLGVQDLYAAVADDPRVHLLCSRRCREEWVRRYEQFMREHRAVGVQLISSCVDRACKLRAWKP